MAPTCCFFVLSKIVMPSRGPKCLKIYYSRLEDRALTKELVHFFGSSPRARNLLKRVVNRLIPAATCTSCAFLLPNHRKRHHKQKPPHKKGTKNKSHHTFRPTHHSQSRSPHLHSPLEQHAPLVPLSCQSTAKGTTNKSHHRQKAPQTKATTRSGLFKPTHHSQSRSPHLHSPLEQHAPLVHLSCPATFCLAQPPFVLPSHRKRHHKQS